MSAVRKTGIKKEKTTLRCAVYTRKSTEHGLELEFNSLDAQREACEAFVRSQAAEGWALLANRYDDAAYSGGNLERPALQKLLADIKADRIDVVVVYKIDRLTRSLSDFAKLIELFDLHKVSFVAITQQFNTTSSMGRLTLNVLLSFAQFERELSSERVRDKIAASRRKGKWTGGGVPLGYDAKNKKLVINGAEAATIKKIFNLYLEHRSIGKLIPVLDKAGIVTKRRISKKRPSGGIPFTHGPLAHLLKNRIYVGEIPHNGVWFAGEHVPLLEKHVFEQVQARMRQQSILRRVRRTENGTLLTGIIFDDRGNRMTPSFSTKKGARYRFYVCAALLRSRKHEAGSIPRVSASKLEQTVLDAVRAATSGGPTLNPSAVAALVERVELSATSIRISFTDPASPTDTEDAYNVRSVSVPWSSDTGKPLVKIEEHGARRPNPVLAQSVSRAHAWLRQLHSGEYATIEELAAAAGMHSKVVRKAIRLAFLAPEITVAILAGNQRPNLALADLNNASLALIWPEQTKACEVE